MKRKLPVIICILNTLGLIESLLTLKNEKGLTHQTFAQYLQLKARKFYLLVLIEANLRACL